MNMTPESIKAAKKERLVLADFGDGFFPAAWDPSMKYWVVAEPREYRDSPEKPLRSRGFDMYPILRAANKSMHAWVSIPSIVEMSKSVQIIKQLVEQLEGARDYVFDSTSDIEDVLRAARSFLQRYNKI